MAADDVRADQCQPAAEHLARAFGFLGKRWTAIILGHLSHGSVGFRDLSRGIGGVSDSVLSSGWRPCRMARSPARSATASGDRHLRTDRAGRAPRPPWTRLPSGRDNLPPDNC